MKKTAKKILHFWRWFREYQGWSAWLIPVAIIIVIVGYLMSAIIMESILASTIFCIMGNVITGIIVYLITEYRTYGER